MGLRNYREILTLVRCLDHLCRGDLAKLGDVLMQRVKALERSIEDGHWRVACQLELLPASNATLATMDETTEAVRGRMLQDRLDEKSRVSPRTP